MPPESARSNEWASVSPRLGRSESANAEPASRLAATGYQATKTKLRNATASAMHTASATGGQSFPAGGVLALKRASAVDELRDGLCDVA